MESVLDPDSLMNEKQVADFAGLSVSSLQSWRVRGGGPRFSKLGSAVRYSRRDVIDWIAQRRVASTSDAGGRK